ncbi:ABC transporter substrate-binding protein [Isoptericola sp. AK164]|uniref:ABC transporter substrate-binding protein n=1 Tax=Isoptericola sp. AK164 TaxID=3024246 RepID=UPI0024185579|nr:ABC transporter substrate-binding protein [Isoptericola sp. AK164]
MSAHTHRAGPVALAGLAATGLVLAGCAGDGDSSDAEASAEGPVTLEWFQGSGVETNIATAEALADTFNASQSDIVVEVDASGPSDSAELDNLMKTRLATGEMPDMFWYNSGSLLQALNPDQTMLDISDEGFVGDLDDSWVSAVSTDEGIFGVPVQTAGGGGMFYSIPIYEELGLEVPTTWDEFLENSDAIRDAGYTAVQQTHGDAWTAQIIVLADYYNVWANDNDWASKYTANEVNFADDPVAVKGFTKLQDVYERDYLNEDYASALLNDGLEAVATGEAGHYPMLGFAQATIATNWPDQAEDVGFFGVPGEADTEPGTTIWMPPALYAPADTEHPDAVKEFMAFVASPAGCDAVTEALGATGQYLVDGCTVPDEAPRIVADFGPYFESGNVAPALEFLSPVKGPNLMQISVEVGSGVRDGQSGAELYDADAAKQAQQLGLPGW